ncbi:hypothetical protein [Pseudalkalibacillus sp. JSM 102089]|uniref:phosphorylase family protein n=1 Tax=Pseudalkalibacillus sp. JSM 102089 TaxID=3229856 RepID=UPI003524F640
MKLYGDFTKDDWIKALNIKEDAIPKSFILHGQWDHEWNLSTWKDILKQEQWIPSWNAIVGEYNVNKVGFANVFGGPIAAAIAHRFAVLGTETFIQTGYFGGLSHEVQYGDILIVTAAEMEDGVSQWYVPNKKPVLANQQLVEEAVKYVDVKLNFTLFARFLFTLLLKKCSFDFSSDDFPLLHHHESLPHDEVSDLKSLW